MKDLTSNRRKYPRVRTEALMSIACVDNDDFVAHTVDLSLNGLRFQCVGLDVEVGQLLRVGFRLGEEEVSVVGKLVRVTELDFLSQELALALIEVDARTRELFAEHLEDAEEV